MIDLFNYKNMLELIIVGGVVMYDINVKNVKKGIKFYFAFLGIGLLFFIILGGVLISNYIKFKSLDLMTTSTRIVVKSYLDSDDSISYSSIYYYMVDGIEYSCFSKFSSSEYPDVEDTIVYYDSKNPSNCMTEHTKSFNKILLIFMILPLLFILFGVINIIKIYKRIKLIKRLNQKGKLIKNLPYYLENTGMALLGVQIQRPVVEYVLSSGVVMKLYGDPRHDRKISDSDGLVDLVIDENNPTNYYVDFEINRLSGNLPSDYFDNISKDKL